MYYTYTNPFYVDNKNQVILFTVILAHTGSSSGVGSEKIVKAVTWNIAAINNNPFEYWITNDDESYNKIMKSVSEYIENPGHITCIHKHIYIHAYSICNITVHTYIHIYIQHQCIYIRTSWLWLYVCMYVWLYGCMVVCMYGCIYMYVCKYVCKYASYCPCFLLLRVAVPSVCLSVSVCFESRREGRGGAGGVHGGHVPRPGAGSAGPGGRRRLGRRRR